MGMEPISALTLADTTGLKFPGLLPHSRLGDVGSKPSPPKAGLPVSLRCRTRAAGCYKATVNESETINEAQPLCLVRGRGQVGGPGTADFRLPVPSPIERS